jgi:photosystem II stability/assembly factor-like uncharacterized protein
VGSRSVRAPAAIGADRSRLVLAAGVLIVAVLAIVYVVLVVSDESTPAGQPLPPIGTSTMLGNVHGLDVDQENGTLYAAARHGVFQFSPQGEPTLIANRRQDTTGFTIAGPGDFLASGHPDGREGLSDDLGLIQSTDDGLTWTTLSLAGDAYFVALEYKHGKVFGYEANSAQLMVSSDRRRWETLAVMPVADFEVSPADEDAMVAATDQGLARSSDGGRTFRTVPAPREPYLLSWPTTGALFAATVDGTLELSTDGGKTWQRRGRLDGKPQALTALDATTVYAATGTGIYVSTDGGRTFDRRYPR